MSHVAVQQFQFINKSGKMVIADPVQIGTSV
jgi:hypothetical protein